MECSEIVEKLVAAAEVVLIPLAPDVPRVKCISLNRVRTALVQYAGLGGIFVSYDATKDALDKLGIQHAISGRNIYVRALVNPHISRTTRGEMIGNTTVEHDKERSTVTLTQPPTPDSPFTRVWKGTLLEGIKVMRRYMVLTNGADDSGDIYRYLLRLQSEVELAQKSATLEPN